MSPGHGSGIRPWCLRRVGAESNELSQRRHMRPPYRWDCSLSGLQGAGGGAGVSACPPRLSLHLLSRPPAEPAHWLAWGGVWGEEWEARAGRSEILGSRQRLLCPPHKPSLCGVTWALKRSSFLILWLVGVICSHFWGLVWGGLQPLPPSPALRGSKSEMRYKSWEVHQVKKGGRVSTCHLASAF